MPSPKMAFANIHVVSASIFLVDVELLRSYLVGEKAIGQASIIGKLNNTT